MSRQVVAAAVTAVQDYMRYLQGIGVTELPLASEVVVASSGASSQERLAQLEVSVRGCTQCPLHTGRTQVVLGTRNPAGAVVFVCESPGRGGEHKGEPVVGPAGQLLTRIIEAIGLRREQVYILNVVKCRPPNNRNPHPEEVAGGPPIIKTHHTKGENPKTHVE